MPGTEAQTQYGSAVTSKAATFTESEMKMNVELLPNGARVFIR